MTKNDFLPVDKQDMEDRGIEQLDFICITGDAYVDHPSFGIAIISRVVSALGFSVGVIAQPNWKTNDDFLKLGTPKYGFLVTSGNIDSMVSNYSAAKNLRKTDDYSPGGVTGKRPDRAIIVYCNKIREIFGNMPIILGGLEGSLRRFAHYDYWQNQVRGSILFDSGADILVYGMGENQIKECTIRLSKGEDIKSITDIAGTCVMLREKPEDAVECPSFEQVRKDKKVYCEAVKIQFDQQDPIFGKPIIQKHSLRYLLQNIPAKPLEREQLDAVYALPYTRTYHPMYEEFGGVPAIREVEHSIAHNRGCYGGCNFCAITFHQGKSVTSRSKESVVSEGETITKSKNFKGYIHDVGGPTANFRNRPCSKKSVCLHKRCLEPEACDNLSVSHSEYAEILRELRNLPKVKKVFVRSGIRFDYLMLDLNGYFFEELIKYHVSGQLKVAPEHCSDVVLKYMGKPPFKQYEKFYDKFYSLNKKLGLKQFLVPYLMSSHPGCTVQDAIKLALYLKKIKYSPEQVQEFYPTPGTISTAMYYTEMDPFTLEKVFVAKSAQERAWQRALLQCTNPKNREICIQALKYAGRSDLIPVLLPNNVRNGKLSKKIQ